MTAVEGVSVIVGAYSARVVKTWAMDVDDERKSGVCVSGNQCMRPGFATEYVRYHGTSICCRIELRDFPSGATLVYGYRSLRNALFCSKPASLHASRRQQDIGISLHALQRTLYYPSLMQLPVHLEARKNIAEPHTSQLYCGKTQEHTYRGTTYPQSLFFPSFLFRIALTRFVPSSSEEFV